MPEPNASAKLVLSTVANVEEAECIGRALVEESLIACATLVPGVQSFFRWKGDTESSWETLLLLKTGAAQLAALERRLHELHSYQTPEFLVLDIESGSSSYLDWLHSCLKGG